MIKQNKNDSDCNGSFSKLYKHYHRDKLIICKDTFATHKYIDVTQLRLVIVIK